MLPRLACLLIAVVLGAAPAAPAATIVVPDSVATVGAALAMAAPGDSVIVQPGTYPGSVTLVDGVAVVSAVKHGAILDGGSGATVVTADSCGPGTVLQGFVVRNGLSSGLGGGLVARTSSLRVEDCRFETNAAMHGGGIGGDTSDLQILDCEFLGNAATQTGGAISVTGLSSPTVQECDISGNSALVGGGIAVRNGATPVITLCLLDANTADQGGGIWYDLFAGGSLTGCTAVFNDAASGLGGAAFFNALAAPVVTECILALSTGGGGVHVVAGGSPAFGCNVISGNAGGDALVNGVDLGTNRFADPRFCDAAAGIYTLQDNSPALPAAPCGQIGAFGAGGCGGTAVSAGLRAASWGSVKAAYRNDATASPRGTSGAASQSRFRPATPH